MESRVSQRRCVWRESLERCGRARNHTVLQVEFRIFQTRGHVASKRHLYKYVPGVTRMGTGMVKHANTSRCVPLRYLLFVVFFCACTDHLKYVLDYLIRCGLLQQDGPARDTALSALSARRLSGKVQTKNPLHAKLGGRYGQYVSPKLCLLALARLDRAMTGWACVIQEIGSQLMEP